MITLLDTDVYTLKAEIENEVAFMHMDYKLPEFTKGIYKELLAQWFEVMNTLKLNGIKVVASIIPDDCEKAKKWQEMFGLSAACEVQDTILFRRVL